MDNSPLNKAHQENRRAEALLKQKRFDECIECHKNAMALLHKATEMTRHPQALESFKLQRDHHERQIRLINLKKIQYENHKNTDGKLSFPSLQASDRPMDRGLQAVYDTMNQHDSFISYLVKRNAGSDNESGSTSDTDDRMEKVASVNGFKHPKGDSIIIEEFKELCNSYRESIKGLLIQLEERNMEVTELKKRVKQLENDKLTAHSKTDNNSLKVITDSSGGTSPYIYSPSSEPSELSPEEREIGELLKLAPLESPSFDFDNMIKNLPSTNN